MKLLLFYRIFLILVVTAITPLALSASAPMNLDKPVRQKWTVTVLTMFQDSTASRKRSSDNDRENQKPSQDDRDDRLKEAQRRAIKEVPRSIPKLKPKPVTERINIRRPPIKVPKKGIDGNIRL